MKKLLLICTLVFCTNCEENKEQKPTLTAEFCEAIHDEEECRREGCTFLRASITFVDSDGNCVKKTGGGFICLHANINSLNNQISEPYLRVLSNGWIAGLMADGGFIDGWTVVSHLVDTGQDHCCAVDPDSCSEPWEDFTGEWYPFEGLLGD